MNSTNFAQLPEPPYYAVIFSSQRTDGDKGYAAMADRMAELASQQPGYLGAESVRDAQGFGITVSYWESLEAIKEFNFKWARRAMRSGAVAPSLSNGVAVRTTTRGTSSPSGRSNSTWSKAHSPALPISSSWVAAFSSKQFA